MILDHAPKPGPMYWDWRCLRCSEPVADHGGVLARWRWRRTHADPPPAAAHTDTGHTAHHERKLA